MASGSRNSSMSGFTVGGKYRLVRQIGRNVHLAVTAGSAEQVAVKLESTKKPSRSEKQRNRGKFQNKSQGNYEDKVYKNLQDGEGIPSVRWSGQEKGYNVLVMDQLGLSLEDLFKSRSPRCFTLKTILMIAEQMISRLEYVHSKYYIHRDITPNNFLMGLDQNCNKIYLIDFSLAKKYCDPRSKKHMPYHEDKIMQSAALFASISAHRGIEQSRRDDMESLGYVLVYFLKGHLPWEGIKAETQRKLCEKIGEKKMSTPVEVLCKDFPGEFATYLNYCRGLGFDEDPDYAYLRQLFRTLYSSLNYQDDDIFDWTAEATATTMAYPAGDSSTPGQKRDAEGDQEESSKRKKVE